MVAARGYADVLIEEQPKITLDELRSSAGSVAAAVLDPGPPRSSVDAMAALGMESATSWALGAGLWQIWGRIGEEWTGSGGGPEHGARLARECALEFLEAVGDAEAERDYCDRWIRGRLGALDLDESSGDRQRNAWAEKLERFRLAF